MAPISLPQDVIEEFADGTPMVVKNYQLDIVSGEGPLERSVPLFEVYSHHCTSATPGCHSPRAAPLLASHALGSSSAHTLTYPCTAPGLHWFDADGGHAQTCSGQGPSRYGLAAVHASTHPSAAVHPSARVSKRPPHHLCTVPRRRCRSSTKACPSAPPHTPTAPPPWRPSLKGTAEPSKRYGPQHQHRHQPARVSRGGLAQYVPAVAASAHTPHRLHSRCRWTGATQACNGHMQSGPRCADAVNAALSPGRASSPPTPPPGSVVTFGGAR